MSKILKARNRAMGAQKTRGGLSGIIGSMGASAMQATAGGQNKNWSESIGGAYKEAQGNDKNWMTPDNSGPDNSNYTKQMETRAANMKLQREGKYTGGASEESNRNFRQGNNKPVSNFGNRRGQIAGTGKSSYLQKKKNCG